MKDDKHQLSQKLKLFEKNSETEEKMYEFTTEGLTNLLHECLVEFYEENTNDAQKRVISRELRAMDPSNGAKSLYFMANAEDSSYVNEFLHDVVKDVLDKNKEE